MDIEKFQNGFMSWRDELTPTIEIGLNLIATKHIDASDKVGFADANRILSNDFSEICHKFFLQESSLTDDHLKIYASIQNTLFPHMDFLALEEHRLALNAIRSTFRSAETLSEVGVIHSLAALDAVDREQNTNIRLGFCILMKEFALMLHEKLVSMRNDQNGSKPSDQYFSLLKNTLFQSGV